MKHRKRPKTKLIRLPIQTITELEVLRTNPNAIPIGTRPSYNAVISYLLDYYQNIEGKLVS